MLSFRGSEHSLSLFRETVYHLNYQGSPEGALVLVEPGVASPTSGLFMSGIDRKAGEGKGTLLQYSCLENPMDGGAW